MRIQNMSRSIIPVATLCMILITLTGYGSTIKPPVNLSYPFGALIDNGDKVKDLSQSPYSSLVQVTFDGYLCTGTLIRYDEVLTAGHCTQNPDGKSIAPAAYTITSADGKKSWHVKDIKTPYSQNTASDFALLKTDNTDKNTPSIALPSKDITQQWLLTHYPPLLAVGFGTDLSKPDKNHQATLEQGTEIPTSQHNAQQTVINGNAWFSSKGLPLNIDYKSKGVFATCAKQPTDHGDSGGPIFYKNIADNKIYLVGVTNWGLTIETLPDKYMSYDHCIDRNNTEQEGQKISVFADMTYGSLNYQKLKAIEAQMNKR